jgi:hypothetical protein
VVARNGIAAIVTSKNKTAPAIQKNFRDRDFPDSIFTCRGENKSRSRFDDTLYDNRALAVFRDKNICALFQMLIDVCD